jgi:hypothetical protein
LQIPKIEKMKKILFTIIAGTFFFFCVMPIIAQDEVPRSISQVDYMKVSPDQLENYLEVERVWKKIHQYNIKQGKYQLWTMEEILQPSGTMYDYNYITRVSFKDEAQYNAFVEGDYVPLNLDKLLTKEEMKAYNATTSSRDLVKSEVWQLMSEMVDDDEDDGEWRYSKFNYFSINEGYTPDDFVAVQTMWTPVHEARIEDDKLEGWVVMRKLLPYGSMFNERYATVDHFKSMTDLMTDDTSRYFDMLGNAEEAFKKTDEGANLVRQEVRRNVMSSKE